MMLFIRTTLVIIALCVLKVFIAYFDGEERRYFMRGTPEHFSYGFYRYKERGDSIIRMDQHSPRSVMSLKPPECKIWDVQNWYCEKKHGPRDPNAYIEIGSFPMN